MKYRVTCLTPTLIGDGNRLSPIDYMVWKEHVNVLDQRRIFHLLAKGPRLEGYLAQLKKADKLDFASWGGFAQNFAGRRIPFEDRGAVAVWERTRAQDLFIPTFTSSAAGPYLPATAIKGALRTGAVFGRWSPGMLRDLAAWLGDAAEKSKEPRLPRNLAAKPEEAVLGAAGRSSMRKIAAGDSAPVSHSSMKIYLLRTSTLVPRSGGGYELGWKSARGAVDARSIEQSTPVFAEMATPGTVFEGVWREVSEPDRARLFQASNRYAASQLARHKEYARWVGLAPLTATLEGLEAKLGELEGRSNACLLSLGWGASLLSKIAVSDTAEPSYRSILRHIRFYQKAVQAGLPFPKTRRVVFQGGKAAQLAGWVLLEVA